MAAIVFDLDDTLYPRVRFVHSGFGAVARASAQRFGSRMRRGLRTGSARPHDQAIAAPSCSTCARAFGLDDVARRRSWCRSIRSHRPDIWLLHDASDVLDDAARRGWRTAILTNGLPSVQAAQGARARPRRARRHVVYADEHARGGKPAAEPFLAR